MKSYPGVWLLVAGAVLAAACLSVAAPVHGQDDAARPEFYTSRVKPIFDANCARCHGALNHRGGLNMSTREGLLADGRHGAAVVPGDPAKSELLVLIKHAGPPDDPMDMPPHADKLSDDKIATIERWIRAGAVMPAAAAASATQ